MKASLVEKIIMVAGTILIGFVGYKTYQKKRAEKKAAEIPTMATGALDDSQKPASADGLSEIGL